VDLPCRHAGEERSLRRNSCGSARPAWHRCLFPPIGPVGNSVRGVKFCREISAEFYLHMFNAPQISTTVLRRRTFLGEVFSNRLRSEDDRKILERFGKGIEVLLIQGAVVFGRVEVLIREIMAHEKDLHGVTIDFAHVRAVDFVSCRLLAGLIKGLIRSRKFVSISRAGHLATLTRVFRKRHVKVIFLEDLDLALEDGESRLLTRYSPTPSRLRRVRLEECDAVQGMSKREVGTLKRLLVRKFFRRGNVIIRVGDTPSEMYILVSGAASVSVSMESEARKRIATFSPGMMFGDMPFWIDSLVPPIARWKSSLSPQSRSIRWPLCTRASKCSCCEIFPGSRPAGARGEYRPAKFLDPQHHFIHRLIRIGANQPATSVERRQRQPRPKPPVRAVRPKVRPRAPFPIELPLENRARK
jgi:Cyclic nucleotide-binding domain